MVRLATVAIVLALIILLVLYARDPFRGNHGTGRGSGTNRPRQASRHMQTKLLKLMHGDRKGAERLLQQARLKYGGKSEDWYCEKVIFDLERDRWR
jgi:uncharacterized protein HemY